MNCKRILTIQDISCVGQCSMTVAMPILSACGHETCILPTAVLSTHTGGFGKPAVAHLDGTLEAMWKHWKENDIAFDAIYTGYLGSVGAVQTAMEIADHLLAPGGVLIVDPAMADHGRRYSGLDGAYAQAMARLCEKADILIPNVTEAAMLTGQEYVPEPREDQVQKLLSLLPQKIVVLTGVGFEPGTTGVALREGTRFAHIAHKKVERSFHGTGDIFAAAFAGALMGEKTLEQSVQIAANYVLRCIERTVQSPAHWYGVRFEAELEYLIRMINE